MARKNSPKDSAGSKPPDDLPPVIWRNGQGEGRSITILIGDCPAPEPNVDEDGSGGESGPGALEKDHPARQATAPGESTARFSKSGRLRVHNVTGNAGRSFTALLPKG